MNGRIDVIDSLQLLKLTFLRGADIPAPFPDCGEDPTPKPRVLDCGESNGG